MHIQVDTFLCLYMQVWVCVLWAVHLSLSVTGAVCPHFFVEQSGSFPVALPNMVPGNAALYYSRNQ